MGLQDLLRRQDYFFYETNVDINIKAIRRGHFQSTLKAMIQGHLYTLDLFLKTRSVKNNLQLPFLASSIDKCMENRQTSAIATTKYDPMTWNVIIFN